MKLATYKDGSRDSQLVVVSRDLGTAHYATGIASTSCSRCWTTGASSRPSCRTCMTSSTAAARHPSRSIRPVHGPAARAYQWADGSAYINHVELVRGRATPKCPRALHRPADVPGRQRRLSSAPATTWWCPARIFGIDFEAEIAVITGDVPMGATPSNGAEGIRLLMLPTT